MDWRGALEGLYSPYQARSRTRVAAPGILIIDRGTLGEGAALRQVIKTSSISSESLLTDFAQCGMYNTP